MKFSRAINYFLTLVWMAYIIASGVHLFSKGFLLTRVSQTNYTGCDKFENPLLCHTEDCATDDDIGTRILQELKDSSQVCFPKKAKLVVLIIDALRYDFGVYDSTIKEPLPFQNKLPIMHELMLRQQDKTRLLKFIADPPTTTLQRLKGLMTGSLPTFIDIGSNFATPEINEDNLIHQIVRNNQSVVFMGDGTWTELFPKQFLRKYDYPSFDIYDLDTIDNAIKEHLPKELKADDWNVLIAHFLGVDHCGHRHGPLHAEMARKLSEMDKVIRDVIDQIDDDTVLIVAGDHGMTINGDHGGETRDEISSLLFMYSKGIPFVPNYLEFDQVLHQIDIVPIISTILGIPIPYSNLGVINFSLIPDISLEGLSRHHMLLIHLWQNARQIHEYFLQYASSTGVFNVQDIEALKHKFLTFSYRVHTIKTETGFINFSNELKRYLHEICQICREIWIKFDPNLISQGLVMTISATTLVFIIANHLSLLLFESVFSTDFVVFIYITNLIVGTIGYLFRKNFGVSGEHAVIFSTNIISLGILAYIALQNWGNISDSMSKSGKSGKFILRATFIFSCSVFFSNSFLINEPKILMYILMGMILYTIYQIKESMRFKLTPKTKIRDILFSSSGIFVIFSVVAVLSLFFAKNYFQCREEQGDCDTLQTIKEGSAPTKDTPTKIDRFDLLPMSTLALMIIGTFVYLKKCGNLVGYSLNSAVITYGIVIAAMCTCAHFILAKSNISHNVPQFRIDALALAVYGIAFIQIFVLTLCPLLLYTAPKQSQNVDIPSDNVVPELYKKIQQSYFRETKSSETIPKVYGLATVYSATLISTGTVLAIVFALLLGPSAMVGMLLVIIVAFAQIYLNSIVRYETAGTLITCIQPTFMMIMCWFLLSHFAFYATSHQPTLSQIDWNAAFVGRSANHDHSVIISGILVILNTFSNVIWFGFLFPLMIAGPFFCYTRKKHNNDDYEVVTIRKSEGLLSIKSVDFDIKRGEIHFYENEKLFIASAFKTASLLLVLQGIRIFSSMVACTIHCRHLMVWKIFAPRFIYEGITTYILYVSLSLGFLYVCRIQNVLNKFIENISNKKLV